MGIFTSPFTKRASQDGLGEYLHSTVRQTDSLGYRGTKQRDFSPQVAVWNFSSLVYACASMNANAVASTPLRLYGRKRGGMKANFGFNSVGSKTKHFLQGKSKNKPSLSVVRKMASFGDDFGEVTEHPVLDCLRGVNRWMNGYDLTMLRVTYLELTGNSYLFTVNKRIGGRSIPTELWPMPSQWVKVKPSRNPNEPMISGYLYGQTDQEALEFSTDEVIRFNRPNPRNLYYGLGKVEAAWREIQLHNSKAEHDQAIFDNGARPDYAVIIKKGASEAALTRFEKEIEQRLRGSKNSGRFLTITGEVDIKPLTFDAAQLGDQDRIIEMICNVFGVPVSKIMSNKSVAGGQANVSDAAYLTDTVLPICRMDEETLNADLLPRFDGEDLILAYDNPVPEDEKLIVETTVKLSDAKIITKNEARAAVNYEPVDGGDEFESEDKPKSNDKPTGNKPAKQEDASIDESTADDSVDEKALYAKISEHAKSVIELAVKESIQMVKQQPQTKAVDPMKSEPGGVPPDVDVLRTAMANYFKDEKERYKSDPTWFTDEEKKKDRDRSLIVLLLLFLTPWAMQSGLMALGKIDADDVAASKFRDQLPTTLRSQVEIAARQINSTTENEVARFQSYGGGEKPIDISEEIFVTQAQRRAEVIAEDQGYKAKILGQAIAVAQDINVLGFIWVAYDGACVTCMGHAGQFYKLQQDGTYNVAELPGFVHPGCRCRMNIVLSSGESVLL